MGRASRVPTLAILITGCAGTTSEPDIESVVAKAVDNSGRGGDVAEIDFGPVLARVQVLRHQFTLINPAVAPLHIKAARARSPAARGSALFRRRRSRMGGAARYQSSRRPALTRPRRNASNSWLTPTVRSSPRSGSALCAAICRDWEVQTGGGQVPRISRGKPGRDVLRIVSRRVLGEGEDLPSAVVASPPLAPRISARSRVRRKRSGSNSIQNEFVKGMAPRSRSTPITPTSQPSR